MAGTLTARYGNATLTAPRYDIEAARPQIVIDSVARAAWGEPRARSTDETAAGVAPPLPAVGSALDPTLFKYVRTIPAGGARLVTIPLDGAALAHSASAGGGFSDLRVIDAGGRQIPYLVERVSEPLSLDLDVDRLAAPPKTLPPSRSARSVYRVKYPFPGLPASRLVLPSSARVFERLVSGCRRARAEPAAPRSVARHDRLDALDARGPGQPRRTVDSEHPLNATDRSARDRGRRRQRAIADWPCSAAAAVLPAQIVSTRRNGACASPTAADLGPPQYDFALLGPQVMGAPALDVAPGAEQPNSVGDPGATLVSPRLFWWALGAAAIVLVGVIARLLRKQTP